MLAFYSNYYEVKAMRAPRVPVEEQYRLIMECRKSGLSDHQWCLTMTLIQAHFTTGLSVSARMAAEIFLRKISCQLMNSLIRKL